MADKQIVFLDIDGILPEVLYDMVDDPSTNISRAGRGGIRVERASTVFPSVTLCCQASMFTGTHPGTHKVVGNLWFDRGLTPPLYRKYTDAKTAAGNYGFALFGWPTIILPQRPGLQLANDDMSPDVKTVYEMMKPAGLKSWQLFNPFSRGVDKWIRPTRPEMIVFAICHEEKMHNLRWDRATFAHMIRELRKGDLPDLLVFYVSGHDNSSHEHGPHTQRDYFRKIVDPLFGEFFAELEKFRPLGEYHFVITSDHGQAAVKRDIEYVITNEILADIMAGAPGGGFKLFDRKTVAPGDTAVICTEAGTAQVHVMNRAAGDWNAPPRFEDDLLPAVAAFEKYKTGDRRFVDIILVRRAPGADYEVYDRGELFPLEVFFDGKEPDYPDAVRRIRGINCSRSGDIIVLVDYSTGRYFGDKVKAGEHGNLHAADSLIPMVITGPGIKETSVPRACLTDLVPTMGRILGFDTPTAEGKSLI